MSTVTADTEGWVVETTGTMPPQESSHATGGSGGGDVAAQGEVSTPESVTPGTDASGSERETDDAPARARDGHGRFAAKTEGDAPTPDSAVTPPVEEPKPPSKRSPEGRKLTLRQEIDALVAEREAVRREIESTRRPTAPQPIQHQTAPMADFPSFEDFSAANPDAPDVFDAYYTAKAEHIAAKQFQAYVRSMQAQQSVTNLQSRGMQAYSDWADTFASVGDIKISPQLEQVLLTDPDGHRLAYELAKHPDQHGDVLYAPDSFALGVALGTLKARLGSASLAPPPSQSNSAPPPISPVGSSHASLKTVSLDEKPFSQWTAADVEAERLAERKKGLR